MNESSSKFLGQYMTAVNMPADWDDGPALGQALQSAAPVAQVAATNEVKEQIKELRYSVDQVVKALEALVKLTERRMR